MIEGRLERALSELATEVEWPAAADLSGTVVALLEAGPERSRRPARLRWSLAVAVAAAVVAVAVAALVFSPAARRAVADLLGFEAAPIEITETPLPPIADDLHLGDRMSLTDARAAVGRAVAVPEALGSPDAVFVDPSVPGGAVTLVYEAGPGLPLTEATRVGALLTAFPATLDAPYVQKLVHTGSGIERVLFDGNEGWWIPEPHTVLLRGRGGVFEDLARLSGPSLLWEDGDLVYRLESRLGLDRSIEVARSI